LIDKVPVLSNPKKATSEDKEPQVADPWDS